MQPTQRTYTDVETGVNFRLFTSNDASKFHLINEEQGEIKAFYISAHTGAEIKLNTGKLKFVDRGEFYSLKEGEKVTHRKFIGFTKFAKI